MLRKTRLCIDVVHEGEPMDLLDKAVDAVLNPPDVLVIDKGYDTSRLEEAGAHSWRQSDDEDTVPDGAG